MANPTTAWQHPSYAASAADGSALSATKGDGSLADLLTIDRSAGHTRIQPFLADGSVIIRTVAGVAIATFAAASIAFAQPLHAKASAAGGAGLRVPHGTAPSSPVNGDIWTTTSGVFARVNGATVALGGAITYAGLPTGSGAWDVGAGNTLTLTRAVSVGGSLGVTGQTSLAAGTASAPGVRLGGVQTGLFQAANTLGFSEGGNRRGSFISGVLILGSGTSPGKAAAGGLRAPGVSQFDANAFFGTSIGLGGADISSWSGRRAVEFHSSALYGGSSGSFIGLASNNYFDGTLKYTTTGTASRLQLFGDSIVFQVASSGSADTAISFTSQLQISSTGLGFFGNSPAARPTGVAVSAAGIHAALVTLGLITA